MLQDHYALGYYVIWITFSIGVIKVEILSTNHQLAILSYTVAESDQIF